MNQSAAIEKISSTPAPTGPLGQATAVEQSRALAEVQAQAYLARQFPRDVVVARGAMQEACDQLALAQRSQFSFPRAGERVIGPTIHLARELARCWGNIQYGLVELSRDETSGSSQMIAFAWDVQTNARSSSTFITPHVRSTKSKGLVPLTDPRDIYENNANMGARRVREAIFAVLPIWFIEEAKARCRQTMETGGGKPVAVRIEECVAGYARGNITLPQLEARVGMPRAEWTVQELATLEVVFQSLRNGETTRDDEFPPVTAPVTAEEVAGQATTAATPRARKTAAAAPQAAAETSAASPPDPGTGTAPRDEQAAKTLLGDIYATAEQELKMTDADVEDDFSERNPGVNTLNATVEQLAAYADHLAKQAEAQS
jgi:hypothetical protein